MKRIMSLAVLVLFSAPVSAVEYKWTGDGFVEVGAAVRKVSYQICHGSWCETVLVDEGTPIPPNASNVKLVSIPAQAEQRQAVTIPPGFHAHTRTDGSTFIHGNENFGLAGPHEGVAPPWKKSGVAGQTVLVGPADFTTVGASCPTATSQYTGGTYSSGSRSVGPIRRILGNLRDRRAARGGLFGVFRRAGGGCP